MCTIRDAVKLGTSDQVIVLRQAQRMPDEKVMHTIELFREEIVPHFS